MQARFDHPSGSFVFNRPPLYPSGDDSLSEAREESAGAYPFVLDPTVEEDVLILVAVGMPQAQADQLEDFWLNKAKGMVEEFTYTDNEGNSGTYIFNEPIIEFTERAYECIDVTLKLLRRA